MPKDHRNHARLLVLVLIAGCASTRSTEMGAAAQAEVSRVLAASPTGDVALATGRAVYLVPASHLAAEKEALLRALRGAPFGASARDEATAADVPHPVTVDFNDDAQVTAWVRSE
ncbi:MAG: hypothetical protein ACYTGZ_21900, partial [Planctomycetota bacterium]